MQKTNRSRLLSLVLTLAIVMSLFAGLTITASAASSWDGTIPSVSANYAFGGGNGTANNPYQIKTAAHLIQLSVNVKNGMYQYANNTRYYFVLTDDIYLSPTSAIAANVNVSTVGVNGYSGGTVYEWLPIGGGNTNYSFQGVFDGGNHTIYNIFYNQSYGSVASGNSVRNNVGLFGKLERGATLKNLKMSGGYFGAQRSVGALVGKSWGNIDNCHNLGTYVYGSESKGVGGLVGANWVDNVTDPPAISNSSNAGTVVSSYSSGNTGGSAGGIAGENEGSIYNCWNTGTVSSPYNAGGLVGSNKNDYNKQTQSGGTVYGGINNCYNAGSVTGKYAGGIAAYHLGSMRNCYNIGSISGSTYSGQIFGEFNSQLTNSYLYVPSGTNAAGNTTVAATTFTSLQKGNLKTWLQDWVTANPNVGYANWTQVSTQNNNYPILVI